VALPQRMGRRLLAGILLGVLLYAGMAAWADVRGVGAAFARVPVWILPAACALSLANYLIRFWKWQRYLALLQIRVETRTSLLIYLSGLSMSVTPGKMGEVFKSWLLRKVTGTPIHQSAPIVVAERFTDLLGYLILVAAGGLVTQPEWQWIFWLTLALCGVGLVLAGSEGFSRLTARFFKRLPYLWRLAPRIEGSFLSTRVLLAPREIVLPTLISVAGWACECAGFWLIADAVVPGSVPFLYAVYAYAFSAVAGAVLIVFPGGLGVTEASLGKLLVNRYYLVPGFSEAVAKQMAAGAVILARLCTLWFAVAVGFAATAIFTRRFGTVDESAS
jgi:uncharacterized protein (TIRG00374 family)